MTSSLFHCGYPVPVNNAETWTLELEPVDTAPGNARQAVAERLSSLPEDVHVDLQLLVSELVTNALVHGDIRPRERIRLTVAHAGEELRVEVCDPGSGMGEPAPTEAPGLAGGYGLRIVDTVASRWGVRRNRRLCVWFTVELAR